MIHFDFTVSDEDAENIFGAISREICDCHEEILKLMDERPYDFSYQVWYNKRILYLKELKSKMTNEVVI